MNPQARRFEFLIWMGVAVTLVILLLTYLLAQIRLRATLGKPLPVLGQVQDLRLTNQLGQGVTLADLRGRPAEERVRSVLEAVTGFARGAAQSDDITLLNITYEGMAERRQAE